jgi:adenine-specific DNA-methyltransferase
VERDLRNQEITMPSAEQLRSRLLKKLSELFQLDQPDLDFGFYRIMHAKAQEVQDFIGTDLLKIVADAFGDVDEARKAELQAVYDNTVREAKEEYGIAEPEKTPKAQKAKAALDAVKDSASAEAEADVYDHLYRFFERYYDDGDFISLRYYTRETSGKAAPYAIPYNGEEVKLHWANADQYYIKSAEYFSNFTFDLRQGVKTLDVKKEELAFDNHESPLKVHFRIVDATEGEHGNVKASKENRRFFIIHKEKPLEFNEEGELVVNFEYRPDPEKTGQENTWRDKRNAETVETILKHLEAMAAAGGEHKQRIEEYLHLFSILSPTDKNKNRPLLAKYVNQYTARNTMDYFIHKDLGGFLRRELDFYIKNEVMHLDDIENAEAPAVESYLTKIKVLRKIAGKLIDFLAQLEDFQKKLWLKKKFIVETNYCITLDRVPEELYAEVAACDAQCEEWIKLFAIDEIGVSHEDTKTRSEDLFNKGIVPFSRPLTVEFLKANNKLVLDTRFFDDSFKARLVASIEDFDEQCDGLLIHSENFQALNLLQERYREQVKCVYIDPPYNTDGDGFVYKDSYMHSTWLSMINDRVKTSRILLSIEGTIGVSIDDNEVHNLEKVISNQFGSNKIGELVVVRSEGGGLAKRIVKGHDYLLLYANDINSCPPLLRPKDIRGDIVEWNGRSYWIETDWLRVEFGKYGTLKYEDILKVKGEEKKQEIDAGIQSGIYRLIPKKDGHIVGRLRPIDGDGSKFYSVVKFLNADGVNQVWDLFPNGGFGYPKPLGLINHYVCGSTFEYKFRGSNILDYFAGSGTTGHAVINLNREDDGRRKYILVEMGDYFDTVLKPRIAKVVYSKDWKDGKPTARHTGVSHCFKYIRLESYEDTLNNLRFNEEPARSPLLKDPSLKEDYMLRYLLDVETRGSQSLLNIDAFADPCRYTLEVKKPGTDEYATRAVDLIETFNYLIGLRVVHYGAPQEFTAQFKRVEDPEVPQDQKTKLVLDGKLQQIRAAHEDTKARRGEKEKTVSCDSGREAGVSIENAGEVTNKNLRVFVRSCENSSPTWWFRKVEGWVPKDPANPNNGQREKVLVVWRKLSGDIEQDNLMLDEWFQKNRISTRDFEFDTIYVNGSNNLPNLALADDTWKVRLIEEEFMKRMWEVQQ